MKRILLICLVFILSFSLVACGKPAEETSNEKEQASSSEIQFTPGKYEGSAEGHNGSIKLEVEVTKDKIASINVLSSEETKHLAEPVFTEMAAKIIEDQSLSVDTVTGATITSNAFISAISNAVKEANVDPQLLRKDTKKEVSTETVELNSDVVVVGGGSAGISAALSAEQKGLSVILLEKNAMFGGHTALSGGLTLVTGSKLQEKLGVTDDTVQKAYDDMFKNGGEKSVPELLMLYSENMGVATDWSVDYIGAPIPDKLTKLGENSVDRGLFYEGGGAGLIDAMVKKLKETKVESYLNTKATSLLTDNGEVVGVEAEGKDGTKYKITAKSVVLAAGGYAGNKEMLPDTLENAVYYGASLSQGEGITMAEAVGADTVNMGYVELFENGVEWHPGIAKSTYNGSMAAWTVSGILVDLNGKRVVNERGPGISIVKQQEVQPNGMLYLFMDQSTFDVFKEKIGGTGISQEMLEKWLENNGTKGPIFAHGDTVEDVAKIVGVDANGLKETIEKYNGFVEKGKDEDFDRPADFLSKPIGDGPYYLVEQRPRYATTLGGLLINTDLQVMNKEKQPIKGLYAVGDTAGGVRGDDSVPGADVGWAITSGYLIGEILNK